MASGVYCHNGGNGGGSLAATGLVPEKSLDGGETACEVKMKMKRVVGSSSVFLVASGNDGYLGYYGIDMVRLEHLET